MDICLTINVSPPVTSTYKAFDIVDVSLQSNSSCRQERMAIVNVNGVPDSKPPDILLKRLRLALCSEIKDLTKLSDKKSLRKREWFINLSSIPTMKEKLLADKKITITWEELKGILFKRVVVDNSQDVILSYKEGEL